MQTQDGLRGCTGFARFLDADERHNGQARDLRTGSPFRVDEKSPVDVIGKSTWRKRLLIIVATHRLSQGFIRVHRNQYDLTPADAETSSANK